MIRDKIGFSIPDNKVKEKLLEHADLTLQERLIFAELEP